MTTTPTKATDVRHLARALRDLVATLDSPKHDRDRVRSTIAKLLDGIDAALEPDPVSKLTGGMG